MALRVLIMVTLGTWLAIVILLLASVGDAANVRSSRQTQQVQDNCPISGSTGSTVCSKIPGPDGANCVWCAITGTGSGRCFNSLQASALSDTGPFNCTPGAGDVPICVSKTDNTTCTALDGCTWCTVPLVPGAGLCQDPSQVQVADPAVLDCGTGTGTTTPAGTGGTAAPAGTGGTATPAGTGGTESPAGTGGTATPAGTGGTESPAGTGGTATPAGTGGTATPAGTGGTATPAGSGGTVTPAGTGGTVTPAGTGGTVTPAVTDSTMPPSANVTVAASLLNDTDALLNPVDIKCMNQTDAGLEACKSAMDEMGNTCQWCTGTKDWCLSIDQTTLALYLDCV